MVSTRTIEAKATIHLPPEDPEATPGTGETLSVAPTEIEYDSSRYDEAAMLKVTGLVDAPGDVVSQYPEASGRPVGLTCRVNDTLIGSGELHNGTIDGDGVWHGTAYGAIHRVRQTTISGSYQAIPVTTLIADIFEAAGVRHVEALFSDVDGLPTYRSQVPQSVEDLADIPEGAGDPQVEDLSDYLVTREFRYRPATLLLQDLLQQFNWHMWTRPTNTIIVDDEQSTETHDVEFVLDHSAGKQLPPYQRVEVTGGRGTVESAPANMATTTGDYIVGKSAPIKESAGSGEPVFEHVDRSISDRMTARRTARGILEEFQRQQAGGEITIVGNPEIRSFDHVTLPEHLGGETYLVSEVTHEVSGDNGFTSRVSCAGLIGESGELEDPTEIIVEREDEDETRDESDPWGLRS